jgi:hypothetical protein
MVDSMIWTVIGLVFGYAMGYNRANKTKERLYYQNELSRKDNEIKILEARLKSCQKWSKILASENAEFRKTK